jgi:hypothetical protein
LGVDQVKFKPACFLFCITVSVILIISGCSVEASKVENAAIIEKSVPVSAAPEPKGATIQIKDGTPSETVRAFYSKLREKKFREAIFLTNLRPAIEGLTDDELKEFAVDFEAVARNVPAEVEINGEIITGDQATVTAKLPDDDDKLSIQEIRLQKRGEIWVILSADPATEKAIEKDGKHYFQNLKVSTHQEEAKTMLDRIAKAQMVYSLQNNGEYSEFQKLIKDGLLPSDVLSSESTGYSYLLSLSPDRKRYSVSAMPAIYGKSGKLSYRLDLNEDGKPFVKSGDQGGKPLGK